MKTTPTQKTTIDKRGNLTTNSELDPQLVSREELNNILEKYREELNEERMKAMQTQGLMGFGNSSQVRDQKLYSIQDSFLTTITNKKTRLKFFIQSFSNEHLQNNLSKLDMTDCTVSTVYGRFPNLDALTYDLEY